MSAASRPVHAEAQGYREPGIALAVIAAAACVVVALAVGGLAPSRLAADPAAGFAPVTHDNGWAKAHAPGAASAGTPLAHDHGWSSTSSGPLAVPVIVDEAGGSGGSTRVRLAQ